MPDKVVLKAALSSLEVKHINEAAYLVSFVVGNPSEIKKHGTVFFESSYFSEKKSLSSWSNLAQGLTNSIIKMWKKLPVMT